MSDLRLLEKESRTKIERKKKKKNDATYPAILDYPLCRVVRVQLRIVVNPRRDSCEIALLCRGYRCKKREEKKKKRSEAAEKEMNSFLR